jgi:hypothetical protein
MIQGSIPSSLLDRVVLVLWLYILAKGAKCTLKLPFTLLGKVLCPTKKDKTFTPPKAKPAVSSKPAVEPGRPN